MRMVINGLAARRGGGQTYLRNLLAYAPVEGDWHVLLLLSTPIPTPVQPWLKTVVLPRLANPIVRQTWESLGLPRLLRQAKADLLFCPGGTTAGYMPCPQVVMFRNMLLADPVRRSLYPWGWMRLRLEVLARAQLHSIQSADGVIFLSRDAEQRIASMLPQPPARHTIIPHGVDDIFFQPAPRLSWLPSRYLAYVSILDCYKAQIEVVRAFAMFRQQGGYDGYLLLVGPEYPPYARKVRRTIRELGLGDAVIVRAAAHEELPAVYQHADVNIFASECENCPNILLEAMAAGRPVVCSSRPPMPEFAADAAMYFDPADPEQLVEALQRMFAADMDAWGGKAASRARHYDWRKTATSTWSFLHSVAGRR